MRKLLLSVLAMVIAANLLAQDFAPKSMHKETPSAKKPIHPNGVQGTLIWETDFDGADWSGTSDNGVPVPANAPSGWSIVDNTGNNFNWRWDTVGPRGKYTSIGDDCHVPREPINSYSNQNGFLMLESDYFHTSANCSQTLNDELDAYIQYDAGIDMSNVNGVYITFTEWNRFCCGLSETSNAYVEISVDGGTIWSSFSIVDNISIGSGNPNYNEINISEIAAGQNNVKFRFHQIGLSHYFWLIDDVRFIEPHDYDMAMIDYWNDYLEYNEPTSTYDFQEGFYAYPWFMVSGFQGFHAAVYNYGVNDLSNVDYELTIMKDDELYESFTATHETTIASGAYDTIHMRQAWAPFTQGDYIIEHNVTHSNESFIYNNFIRRDLNINDTILSTVDFEETNSSISPSDYLGFEEGNGLGFEFTMPDPSCHSENDSYYILNGIYIKPAAPENAEELLLFENDNVHVFPSVYKYNNQDSTYIEQITGAEVNCDLNDTNQIVYLSFAQDGTSEYIFEGGKYLVGVFMFGTYTDELGHERSWKLASVEGNKFSKQSTVIINNYDSISSVSPVYQGVAIALDIEAPIPFSNKGFSVMFQVNDSQENPIEGATIEIDGETLTTNAEGMAEFYTESPNYYPYIITSDNYNTSNGTLDLCDGGEIINITLNGVGITEIQENLSVYPNPTTGQFTISDIETGTITIKNVAGQIVYSGELSNHQVDISDQPDGMYFIEVKNGQEVFSGRVIKQ